MRTHWPQRRHGNDGVPECIGNAGEFGLGDVFLGVEHYRREDNDGHAEGEDEEAEFAGADGEGLAEDPQPCRVSRELEDAENTENSQRHERSADVIVLRNAQTDVVRQNGDDVYHTHYRPRVPANMHVPHLRSRRPLFYFVPNRYA